LSTPLPKYDFLKNKICPYCQSKIKSGADFTVCSQCGTPHHKECWEENLGCTTYGCKNNPLTDKTVEIDSTDPANLINIGDQTIDSIRESLKINSDEITIECPNCKSEIDESSDFCKYCGYNLREKKLPDTKSEKDTEEKKEFEKEFKKRYKDKVGITRNRFYITLGSFVILISAIAFLTYTGITKLNKYFSSDEYKIKSTIENWKDAWEKEDINKFNSYMTDDYEYYGRDGKRIDFKERVKRIEWTFKNYKKIKIDFSEYKMITDSSTSDVDKKIQFNQTYESDKFNEKGIKTLRMYKSAETKDEWKIYREFFD